MHRLLTVVILFALSGLVCTNYEMKASCNRKHKTLITINTYKNYWISEQDAKKALLETTKVKKRCESYLNCPHNNLSLIEDLEKNLDTIYSNQRKLKRLYSQRADLNDKRSSVKKKNLCNEFIRKVKNSIKTEKTKITEICTKISVIDSTVVEIIDTDK